MTTKCKKRLYETVRMQRMKENFMALHRDGWTIREIAEYNDVHRTSVYGALEEIAQKAGVTRASLLERPFYFRDGSAGGFTRGEKADLKKLMLDICNAQLHASILIEQIDETVGGANG